ncbi:putative aldo-keto reductase [Daldinia caldariorum]|uniref:putative aldo-keto reductase n=1 Tax=Daldinia caldariorum TaxID=326644 RepID=UPI00200763FB|nr:putative aldo-keto reductase [Daldinia caldariorum]KAI1473171.1 putative aldo-keto reductase [Daldinia caldariorum]
MPAKPILRRLGKNGPLVPALGLGLMGASLTFYGNMLEDEERFKLYDRALELGQTFWDTSDQYGDSEEHVGKWFKKTGKRDQIFIASKYGFVKGGKYLETDSSYEYTKQACDRSLKALGVDQIDLYYIHSVNPETPIEETMRALKELQEEGKIKYIGLSMVSSATLRRAVKISPVAAVQTEYSVLSRVIEGPGGTDLLAACRELGVAVVAATPLGRGILTQNFGEASVEEGDARPQMLPQFQAENRERNAKVVAQFTALAKKKGCTVSQLGLAWLLKQGDDIFAIPGTKKIKYLEQNWDSQDVVLSDAEEKEIRAFFDENPLSGPTMPEQLGHYRFRDTKELN